PQRDAVIAAMLLGGQRVAQLLRTTPADLDMSAGTIQLLDPKGRNRATKPRRHVVPIVADLVPIIERRRQLRDTLDTALVDAAEITCGPLVVGVCADMTRAGETGRGPVRLRDLRRTAEPHLAALGVSTDVRAQIHAHGLGGVQARHYDRHDYAAEKR